MDGTQNADCGVGLSPYRFILRPYQPTVPIILIFAHSERVGMDSGDEVVAFKARKTLLVVELELPEPS